MVKIVLELLLLAAKGRFGYAQRPKKPLEYVETRLIASLRLHNRFLSDG